MDISSEGGLRSRTYVPTVELVFEQARVEASRSFERIDEFRGSPPSFVGGYRFAYSSQSDADVDRVPPSIIPPSTKNELLVCGECG